MKKIFILCSFLVLSLTIFAQDPTSVGWCNNCPVVPTPTDGPTWRTPLTHLENFCEGHVPVTNELGNQSWQRMVWIDTVPFAGVFPESFQANTCNQNVFRVDTAGNVIYIDWRGKKILLKDANAFTEASVSDSTRLVQDSILVHYLGGVVSSMDTIRFQSVASHNPVTLGISNNPALNLAGQELNFNPGAAGSFGAVGFTATNILSAIVEAKDGNTIDSTRLIQDSILVHYIDGVLVKSDTIRLGVSSAAAAKNGLSIVNYTIVLGGVLDRNTTINSADPGSGALYNFNINRFPDHLAMDNFGSILFPELAVNESSSRFWSSSTVENRYGAVGTQQGRSFLISGASGGARSGAIANTGRLDVFADDSLKISTPALRSGAIVTDSNYVIRSVGPGGLAEWVHKDSLFEQDSSLFTTLPVSACFTTREVDRLLSVDSAANILWLGDSRTASQYTRGQFRRRMSARYGHAGFGAIMPNNKYDAWQRGQQGVINTLDLTGNANNSMIGIVTEMEPNSYIRYSPVDSALCNFTEIDVWYEGGQGSIALEIDGITYAVPAGTVGLREKHTITGLADTPHQIFIRSVGTSNTYIYNLNLRIERKGIRLHFFGNGGIAMDDVAGLIAANPYYVSDIKPALTYVRLGVNRIVEQTTDEQITNLESIINVVKAEGGFYFNVIGEPDNAHPTKSDSIVLLNTKFKDFAYNNNYGYVDLYSVVPEWQTFWDQGYANDDVHEGTTGGIVLGEKVYSSFANGDDCNINTGGNGSTSTGTAAQYWNETTTTGTPSLTGLWADYPRVGIATNDPQYHMDVNGSAHAMLGMSVGDVRNNTIGQVERVLSVYSPGASIFASFGSASTTHSIMDFNNRSGATGNVGFRWISNTTKPFFGYRPSENIFQIGSGYTQGKSNTWFYIDFANTEIVSKKPFKIESTNTVQATKLAGLGADGTVAGVTVGSGLKLDATGISVSIKDTIAISKNIVEGNILLTAQTYETGFWRVPDFLDGAKLIGTNVGFSNNTGSVDFDLQRLDAANGSAASIGIFGSGVTTNYKSGSANLTLVAGQVFKFRVSSVTGTVEGAEITYLIEK